MKRLIAASFWKGTDPYLLARVMKASTGYAQVAIVQADVTSIAYEVFNRNTLASLSSGSLAAADVILNTLNTGSIWTFDATGFNFVWQAPRSLFTASVTHRIVITLTLTGNKAVVVTFELPAGNPAGD